VLVFSLKAKAFLEALLRAWMGLKWGRGNDGVISPVTPFFFVEEKRTRIKQQQPRLVKIKTMKKIEASVSKVEYQQDDF
jgi:hypothetical protein